MARVFVGLSGGVDSAVSAALLEEAGHDVYGCFIRIWRPEFLECTWREDRLDALRVAAHLGIPFRETDLSQTYESAVMRPMIDGYQRGETPNPDMLCNEHIKFDAFLAWAQREGADVIATGHYARVGHSPTRLLKGVDGAKDQSYFLARVAASAFEHALFPVGAMTKTEVREAARARRLPVARKRDSQGLCFVGDISIPEFLSRYVTVSPGAILSTSGELLGEHEGAIFYTIGQRHGLRLGSQRPYYVVATDTRANTVTVSHDPRDAERSAFTIGSLNWISEPTVDARYDCVLRYHHRPIAARLTSEVGDQAQVILDAPAVPVRGQTCALYSGETLVGSGIVC